ncbi:C10 family peptidase, partial [Streptococcus danieliae]|nr:C10 family peptidase [Streptococcus danieliae]
MRYLGVVLKAEYKDDGTSMESKDAINWINDWTSLKATKLKEYNANEIFMAANFFSNKLVYMRGNRGKNDFLGITIKYTGGHAWVADGAFSAR